jgi:hypothetical protein
MDSLELILTTNMSELELKLYSQFSPLRRLWQFINNVKYDIERPEILFCRVCGDFELHKWITKSLSLSQALYCINCGTVYS